MFNLFQTNIVSVLFGCYKSRSGCCIYMHVLSVCLQVFHLDVAYVCNGFQMFFRCFSSVSDVCFECFICLLFVYRDCCI
jgi:hypothetical protein